MVKQTIADFEDGTSPFTVGSTSDFSVATGGSFNGTKRLSSTSGANHQRVITDSAITWDNEDGRTLRGYVRCDDGGTNLAYLCFGSQTTSFNGYSVHIDQRNSTGGSSALQLRLDNSTTPLSTSTDPTISVGVWYRIEIEWQNVNPRITARVYEGDSDTVLGTVTSNDTTYTSGRLGVHRFNQSSFDDIALLSDEVPIVGPFPTFRRST